MHFFTSITTNYIPKARVLAKSLREHCDDVYFTVVFSDDLPDGFKLEDEPFDQILYIKDLDIPVDNLEMWIFSHRIVELCTAVKGAAIFKLLQESPYNKIIYIDPDIVVFDDLSDLSNKLDNNDIILTPHITKPEETIETIYDMEITALKHGIYNLGFVALKRSENAMAFAKWWRDRLVHFCYDDIPGGLFTDQRWCDLVPAFFDGVLIEKDCSYNVAAWNLSNRKITKENGSYFVNGKPLQFYHFTGFDSGANKEMTLKYGSLSDVMDLIDWYEEAQKTNGQENLGKIPCKYATFSNGEQITNDQRKILRFSKDILSDSPEKNPFIVNNDERCFYNWYKRHVALSEVKDNRDEIIYDLQQKLDKVKRYLAPLIWIRRLFLKIRRKR